MIEELRKRGLLPIVERVARLHFVTVDQLVSRDVHKSIRAARSALYVELYLRGLSTPEIGRVLGRDHTSVLAGIKKARVRVAIVDDANTEHAA